MTEELTYFGTRVLSADESCATEFYCMIHSWLACGSVSAESHDLYKAGRQQPGLAMHPSPHDLLAFCSHPP